MIFTIRKGKHFSNHWFYKLFSSVNIDDRKSYYITFKDTAIYTDETPDRFDVNKLFGFSIGLHHKNSYRFGWNCLENKIHIYAYCYVNGERVIKDICVVDTNAEYKFIIKLNKGKCIFSVIDSTYKLNLSIIDIPTKKVFGYELWPYFGGNKTAPQKIDIELIKNDVNS